MAAAHTKGFYSRNRSKITRWLRATGKTADFTIAQPANTVVKAVYIKERAAAAITGGLRVGTSAAGTQVVTAQAVAASANVRAAATAINPILATAGVLYFEAVTGWNSAEIDVKVELEEVEPT